MSFRLVPKSVPLNDLNAVGLTTAEPRYLCGIAVLLVDVSEKLILSLIDD